jgi:large subunit ribosomal protein L18
MAITSSLRRSKIKAKIRSIVSGTSARPRLAVFRSNKAIYAQLIDDITGATLCSASSGEIKSKGAKSEISKEVGKKIAQVASTKGVTEVVFDRAGYLYHGRVKALADGAREGGLKF